MHLSCFYYKLYFLEEFTYSQNLGYLSYPVQLALRKFELQLALVASVYPMYVSLECVLVMCFRLACWVNLRGRLRGCRLGGTPGALHTSRGRH